MDKLALITLGCNKNQTDSEFLIAGLSEYFEITNDLEIADIIVLSPCSFLEIARIEAEEYIKTLQEYKKIRCKCLVITGCYSEHLKSEILEKHFDVDLVIGLTSPKVFAEKINEFLKLENRIFVKGDKTNFGVFSDEVNRIVSHQFYAYVKISDGCNNYCSYCLIPNIRGEFRSRPKEIILNEIESLLKQGIKEINIVSQDIGMYGEDIYGKNYFIELLNDITKLDYDFFVRLLYLHPKHITPKLVRILKNNSKILHYLDIPIQHINNEILESMNRKITKSEIIKKLNLLRQIEDIVLRTTFIVGYPLEDLTKFEELKMFIIEQKFDKLGVFAYSYEKGTKAFKNFSLKQQINDTIKQERIIEIMQIQKQISLEKNKKFVGKEYGVLFDKFLNKNVLLGRIYSMAPEVDGFVRIKLPKKFEIAEDFDGIFNVKITKANAYDLEGELI